MSSPIHRFTYLLLNYFFYWQGGSWTEGILIVSLSHLPGNLVSKDCNARWTAKLGGQMSNLQILKGVIKKKKKRY